MAEAPEPLGEWRDAIAALHTALRLVADGLRNPPADLLLLIGRLAGAEQRARDDCLTSWSAQLPAPPSERIEGGTDPASELHQATNDVAELGTPQASPPVPTGSWPPGSTIGEILWNSGLSVRGGAAPWFAASVERAGPRTPSTDPDVRTRDRLAVRATLGSPGLTRRQVPGLVTALKPALAAGPPLTQSVLERIGARAGDILTGVAAIEFARIIDSAIQNRH